MRHLGSLPYLYTKNETMDPLHVAILTVKRELPKYEIIFSIWGLYLSPPYLYTKNETMAPLRVATLTVKKELPKYEIIFSI